MTCFLIPKDLVYKKNQIKYKNSISLSHFFLRVFKTHLFFDKLDGGHRNRENVTHICNTEEVVEHLFKFCMKMVVQHSISSRYV